MRCIVIDAEGFSSRSIVRLLEKVKDIEIVATARTGQEGQRLQEKEEADLLLVSADVPDVSRLKQSTNHLPQIIFVSGAKNPAPVTYLFNATDILTKPLSVERLRKSIDRARLRKRMFKPEESHQELFLRLDDGLRRIKYEDIIYIERNMEVGGCRMRTSTGYIPLKWDLRESVYKLGDDRFQKVNRDFVVNLKKVTGLFPTSLTIADKTLAISRANHPKLELLINSAR